MSSSSKTKKGKEQVHGSEPQMLIEKVTRMRIYETLYWKQHCFSLNSETLVEKAAALQYVCGVYGGNRRPSPFLSLVLKMLQMQPSQEIVLELLLQDDEKYLRILAAFYFRLVGAPVEIYQYLEPLLSDYRKIRRRNLDGLFEVVTVDVLIDEMLNDEHYFDTFMPRLAPREVFERQGKLQPRVSALAVMFPEEMKALQGLAPELATLGGGMDVDNEAAIDLDPMASMDPMASFDSMANGDPMGASSSGKKRKREAGSDDGDESEGGKKKKKKKKKKDKKHKKKKTGNDADASSDAEQEDPQQQTAGMDELD